MKMIIVLFELKTRQQATRRLADDSRIVFPPKMAPDLRLLYQSDTVLVWTLQL